MSVDDVGNICRCICDGLPQDNATLLIPARHGCSECNADVCSQYFAQCAQADRAGGGITVHCINRSAIAPRLAINSMILLTFFLVFAALCKERFKSMRRAFEAGHRNAP
mmetsp:Transcript_43899/g.82438  ORF Transcript_43899/g.82438 Transcript_43899/m.82438 type:complete len:109 (+) Transcript_43899:72-398(+)